mmetsp:Transcript_31606/g.33930  ORF Transcript_31606/g.33930 Transcript_31606/m.33930 type:complete len:157 (+) Transcript_31606:128-598(+)
MNVRESGIDFHHLLLKSSLKKKYSVVLEQLLMTGNIRHVIDDETLYSLLPSDAFSWNLTNRILFLWMVMVLLVLMHYSIHRKNVREKGGRKFVVIFPTRHYPYSQTHSTRIRTRRHFLIVVSFSCLYTFILHRSSLSSSSSSSSSVVLLLLLLLSS